MNLEKLKEHECRFCKHYDTKKCLLFENACAYQHKNSFFREGLPIAWELHPDIAEAMQPETTELNCNCDNAWDTLSVIAKLVEAADLLLHKKDYDGHGWEEMEYCYKRGLEILKTSAPPAGGE